MDWTREVRELCGVCGKCGLLADAQRVHNLKGRAPMPKRLLTFLAFVLVAGCSSSPPTVCSGSLCTGPAHTYTTWDDLVFILTTAGVVPVPPGTADGPARIVKPIRPISPRRQGGY
jgi:hypothetical protein